MFENIRESQEYLIFCKCLRIHLLFTFFTRVCSIISPVPAHSLSTYDDCNRSWMCGVSECLVFWPNALLMLPPRTKTQTKVSLFAWIGNCSQFFCGFLTWHILSVASAGSGDNSRSNETLWQDFTTAYPSMQLMLIYVDESRFIEMA